MANISKKDVENSYDGLVQRIVDELTVVLDDLKEAKSKERLTRKTLVQDVYFDKLRDINETKRRSPTTTGVLNEHYERSIRPLEKEFHELMNERIQISRGVTRTLREDQKRINDDIKKIDKLLDYIKEKTGNKKNKRALDTRAMYTEIEAIYRDVINSRKEAAVTEKYHRLKTKIEEKAEHIIREMEALTIGGPH